MSRREIWTPIGLGAGATLIALAILLGGGWTGARGFISAASFITVFGGLTAALFVHYHPVEFKTAWVVFKNVFRPSNKMGYAQLLDTFVHLSQRARRDGLLSLEQEAEELDEPFIRKGVLLAVDGIEADMIKEIMTAEMEAEDERYRRGLEIIEKAGEWAPAWGMVGTLIGLVLMLQSLNDPSSLGPQMALALITTFYGMVLANLVFHPLAGKLSNYLDEELHRKQVMLEGIIAVQSGLNPMVLEEKMSAFLSREEREALNTSRERHHEVRFDIEGGRENAL